MKEDEMGGARAVWLVVRTGHKNGNNVFIRKPEEKRPLGRPRLRWRLILWEYLRRQNRLWFVDWTHLAEDKNRWRAVVKMVVESFGSRKAGDFLDGWATVSFSKRTLLCEVSTWISLKKSRKATRNLNFTGLRSP
jgi:hypothetical protein